MLSQAQQTITAALNQALTKLDLKLPAAAELNQPDEQFGDFSSNVAMVLSSEERQGRAPRIFAESLMETLRQNEELRSLVTKIEVAGPGFINFTLQPSFYLRELQTITDQGAQYGRSQNGQGKTVVIDYSSPNIAKRFSVGHLRSTIIGQALYNCFQFQGWRAIGDNHLGDWGTQFGQMIVAIDRWAEKPVDQLSVTELEQLYVRFNQEAKTDPTLPDAARQAFASLEKGQPHERQIWEQLIKTSLREFAAIYDLLGVKIDYAYGESSYEDLMPTVVAEAQEKGLAQESEGALVLPLPDEDLPPAMLRKRDGSTTYLTRDLAAIRFRRDKWQPDLAIYEVGAEQKLHFRQVFWAAELLGYATRSQLIHLGHGLIRLPEGKMSTRAGRTIKLEDVLSEAVTKAGELASDPSLAQTIGIGAVKYNDLKNAPTSGYVFRWEEMLNFQGNSGPYLQYTHARAKSVVKQAGEAAAPTDLENYQLDAHELAVLRRLAQFPLIIDKVVANLAPNTLCTYLFDLAQSFNAFYNVDSIRNAPEPEQRAVRLLITQAMAQVMATGLGLLGIEAPDKV